MSNLELQSSSFYEQIRNKSLIDVEIFPLSTECLFVHKTGQYPCKVVEVIVHLNDSGIDVDYGVQFTDNTIDRLWKDGTQQVEVLRHEQLAFNCLTHENH